MACVALLKVRGLNMKISIVKCFYCKLAKDCLYVYDNKVALSLELYVRLHSSCDRCVAVFS